MALIKCKECGNQISKAAESCPHCGAPNKKPRQNIGCGTAIGAVLLLGFAASMLQNSLSPDSPRSKPASTNTPPGTQSTAAHTSKPAQTPNWTYDSNKDPMTEQTTKFAVAQSEDTALFDFPYKQRGGSYLNIVFRKGPKGFDAYLQIDKGQMLCSYSDCKFRLKIGDKAPQTWTGLQPTSYNSEVMFVRDAKQFEKIIRSGKPIKIGINFHRSGEHVFTFKTGGYKPL